MKTNPKVFISYAHSTEEFSNRILEFSNKLRDLGIDAIIDQYEESPPEGWPRWMENEIRASDYVLVVCTKTYLNKINSFDNKEGKGVNWEINIVYQHIYDCYSNNTKFIPIIFKDSTIDEVPTPLKSATFYFPDEQKSFTKLLNRLRGIPNTEKPPLGEYMQLPAKERRAMFITSVIDLEAWNKADWRGAGFMLSPDSKELPILVLPFKNEIYARKIFTDWITRFGDIDKFDDIRIAIIEGEILDEPKGYTIHISSNIIGYAKRMPNIKLLLEEQLFVDISRIQRAEPRDNFKMLNMFKSCYNSHKKYLLIPGIYDESKEKLKPIFELAIRKKELIFKNAKDIKENDIDSVVIAKNMPWKKR